MARGEYSERDGASAAHVHVHNSIIQGTSAFAFKRPHGVAVERALLSHVITARVKELRMARERRER